jgi:Uma2 family endonuclease
MTQAKVRFASFEEYLSYSDETDERYELIDGELFALPPESENNDWLSDKLFLWLAASGLVLPRLVKRHTCEIQVTPLRPKDPRNRYPDLVILRSEHLELTERRLTITLDMPPPRVVMEVLSPGKENRDRDLIHKRNQYAARSIPEYWLIDPEQQSVMVLRLKDDAYEQHGIFSSDIGIDSPELGRLALTTEDLFN